MSNTHVHLQKTVGEEAGEKICKTGKIKQNEKAEHSICEIDDIIIYLLGNSFNKPIISSDQKLLNAINNSDSLDKQFIIPISYFKYPEKSEIKLHLKPDIIKSKMESLEYWLTKKGTNLRNASTRNNFNIFTRDTRTIIDRKKESDEFAEMVRLQKEARESKYQQRGGNDIDEEIIEQFPNDFFNNFVASIVGAFNIKAFFIHPKMNGHRGIID